MSLFGKTYNLADIVRFNFKYARRFDINSIGRLYVANSGLPKRRPRYPRECPHPINYDLLQSIVLDRQQDKFDGLAIHCRLGDVVSLSPSVSDFVTIIKKYNLNKKYKKCKLFYGIHHLGKASEDDSLLFLDNFKSEVKKLGMECNVESNDADDDFVSISTASCFIPSILGFSWLAATINPNNVIWDIQNPPKFPWLEQYCRNRGYHNQLIDGYKNQLNLRNKDNDK